MSQPINPWYLVLAGIVFVFVYSLGQYGRSRYKDIFKFVGVFGTGFIMLKLYWNFCPTAATFYLFIMLIISSVSALLVRLYYRSNDDSKPTPCRPDSHSDQSEFDPDSEDLYEKAVLDKREGLSASRKQTITPK